MNNNLELSNIGALDESISNAIGMTDNLEYSNLINESLLNGLTENTSLLNADAATVSGGGSSYVNPETIKAGTELTTSLVKALSAKKEGSCLKPSLPESFLNRKKWATYKQCKEDERKAEEQRAEAERQRTEQERLRLEQAKTQSDLERKSGKILGMPKGVAIGVGIGIIVLAVGGFIIYKKYK